MSTSSKKTSIELPQYQKQTPSSFNTPYGSANYSGGGWNVNANEQATINQASQIRGDLLKSLGLGGNISQDSYTKEYMNEILRLSQPKTENALIGRGLGGSSVYKDALTDLITKASTQAILGGQQYKQNDLSMLSGYLDNQYATGNQLAQLAAGNGLNEEQLYQARYLATMPHLANIVTPNTGLEGAIQGGLQGFVFSGGNPIMAAAGAGNGYLSNQGGTQNLMLYQLAQQAAQDKKNMLSLQNLFGVKNNARPF